MRAFGDMLRPMAPFLKSLSLHGFRSVRDTRIDFSNPTFLVGRNGAGKSNLVDALTFLADAMSSPLSAVVSRRGGLAALGHRNGRGSGMGFGLAVELGPLADAIAGARYALSVRSEGGGFEVESEDLSVRSPAGRALGFVRRGTVSFEGFEPASVLDPFFAPDALVLPAIGGDSRVAPLLRALSALRSYAIEPSALRPLQDPDGSRGLAHDGHNAAGVLREIERSAPEDLPRIDELLSATLPYPVRVRPVALGSKLALEFQQEGEDAPGPSFDAALMSDGTLRTLGLILAVFQRPRPSVLVLEEPESTLHPGALGVVLDLVRMASETMQVVVTTHSPDLLDAKWIEDHHLRVVTWESGSTRVRSIAGGARRALQEGLMGAGELLRANALEPLEDEDALPPASDR